MKKYQLGNWEITIALPNELPTLPLYPEQVHGNAIITAAELSKSRSVKSPLPSLGEGGVREMQADGIVITQSDKPVAIQTADCLPLVLMTPDAALALHVSRKSLIAGLLNKVPEHINPKDIEHVFFGPHICVKHFTFDHIGDEVKTFINHYPAAVSRDKPIGLSLLAAVQQHFDEWEIEKATIVRDERCTYQDLELLSYRRSFEQGKNLTDRFHTIVNLSM